jgi:hypothetical protein
MADGFRQNMNCQLGVIWRQPLLVILVVKVKNMIEAEMGKSDCGNSCTGRRVFLDGLGRVAWGRVAEKKLPLPFVCTLCNICRMGEKEGKNGLEMIQFIWKIQMPITEDEFRFQITSFFFFFFGADFKEHIDKHTIQVYIYFLLFFSVGGGGGQRPSEREYWNTRKSKQRSNSKGHPPRQLQYCGGTI